MLSRHENLNFNVNEVLSSVFAPKTTWNVFPRLYYINGKKYDLTEYTDKLKTEYPNLGWLNASLMQAFLPINLIGIYKDKLYTNYVNNISETDSAAVFEYGNEDIIFPNDKDRQQLAWANFTGQLSKYIADSKLFAYKYGSYYDKMTYGRFLDQANIEYLQQNIRLTEDKSAFKLKDGLNLTKKIKDSFGRLQQSIFSTQVKANFFAKILGFLPFVKNFNASSTGSVYGLRLLNNIFPFNDTGSDQGPVYVMFLAIKLLCNWLSTFVHRKWSDKGSEYKASELKTLWNKIDSNLKANGNDFIELIKNNQSVNFKVQSLLNEHRWN